MIEEKYDKHESVVDCQICYEPMGEYNAVTSIPSCCGQGYYHKKCIQTYAVTAGYFAHCPACGYDAEGYRMFLRARGVFCPDKDAGECVTLWTLLAYDFSTFFFSHIFCSISDHLNEKDPYRSLQSTRKICDAEMCRCRNGREFAAEDGEWQIIRCKYCNYTGTHAKCRGSNATELFACEHCKRMVLHVKRKNRKNARRQSPKNEDEKESESVSKKLKRITCMSKTEILDMFFAKSDFNVKPRPPTWLVWIARLSVPNYFTFLTDEQIYFLINLHVYAIKLWVLFGYRISILVYLRLF